MSPQCLCSPRPSWILPLLTQLCADVRCFAHWFAFSKAKTLQAVVEVTRLIYCYRPRWLLELHSQDSRQSASVIHLELFGETTPQLVNLVLTSAPKHDVIYPNKHINPCIVCSPHRKQTKVIAASSRKVLSVLYQSLPACRIETSL